MIAVLCIIDSNTGERATELDPEPFVPIATHLTGAPVVLET
jgi:hypothetical protein